MGTFVSASGHFFMSADTPPYVVLPKLTSAEVSIAQTRCRDARMRWVHGLASLACESSSAEFKPRGRRPRQRPFASPEGLMKMSDTTER